MIRYTEVHNSQFLLTESTSPGVIMNRFSKDIGQVDDMLPMSASDTLSIAVQSLVILALSVYTNYYLIIVSGEAI